ncbi:SWIM zinc finger family protein [Streptomyces sp. AC627_RSS907]|uniref:SWIM zinc finger family protein n=1 Tax=Streptomyces sp. AC627_RSS907 TaxID=2823684 RepID=UPI001C25A4B5|nr:SWIM zinc finger family protein [Streptomyces sp. AC627_RSS907]
MNRNGTGKRPGDLVLPKPPPVPGQRKPADGPWGILWIAALESPSRRDSRDSGHAARLGRARTYARRGAVGDITVRTGELSARVTGSGRRPYRVTLRVPELPEADVDRLLKAWTDDVDAAAELSRGELGEATARIAVAADEPLVPRPGLTDYACTCPDWGSPCKHAAAVSYQYARAVDSRPDALLLLRGHRLDAVCKEAALRCAEREAAAEQAAEAERTRAGAARGVPAGEAFARAGQEGGLPPLPELPAPATGPVTVAPFPEPGHEDSLVAPDRLRMLADDAAHRAADAYSHAVATGGAPAARLWLDTDLWLDTVRRAARADGDPRVVGRLLNSSVQARARLARASAAWKYGGQAALAVLDGGQVPPRAAATTAREQLLTRPLPDLPGPPLLRRTGGRLQLVGHGVELRYGPDGHWYPFRKQSGQWWPAGPPSQDALEAVLPILPGT